MSSLAARGLLWTIFSGFINSPEILPLKDAKRKRADNDIQTSIARMKEVGERIRSQRLTNASESEIDPLIARELFVNWLAADSLPFSLCKSRAFRAFLQCISPATNDSVSNNQVSYLVDTRAPR